MFDTAERGLDGDWAGDDAGEEAVAVPLEWESSDTVGMLGARWIGAEVEDGGQGVGICPGKVRRQMAPHGLPVQMAESNGNLRETHCKVAIFAGWPKGRRDLVFAT